MQPVVPLTVITEETIQLLARRQLGSTALLFLAGHRPLAFAGGQILHMLTPLAALVGFGICAEWAQILSDDECLDRLERALNSDDPLPEMAGLSTDSHDTGPSPAAQSIQSSTADHVA